MHYRELSQKIDLSPLGLEPADNEIRYFCTPVDADIFARAGVDGVHYVTLPAYGEMIFCVDPSGCHEREVFAIAEDFEDLWRLLLTCGDMMLLAEADSFCDETEFWTNVDAGLMEETVQTALKRLAEVTGLPSRDRKSVYEPLLLLRETIDYSKVQYSEEYWELHQERPACPDVEEAEESESAEMEDIIFECHEGGKTLAVENPFTNQIHTLTVTDCHAETLQMENAYGMEMPSSFYLLTCTMQPKAEGWYLRSVTQMDERGFRCQSEGNIAIIGGADGPTAIAFVGTFNKNYRIFPSSLCFTLPKEMNWQLVWRSNGEEEEILPLEQ